MKHIKKALSLSIAGALGVTVIGSLTGCEQVTPPNDMQNIGSENTFMVIEQTGTNPDTYNVIEQYPTSGATRAILRDSNGIERVLSEAELKAIAEEEARKVEAGTSRLAQEGAQMSDGGLSLGEVLLSAAAGSLIGGMLANALMGNKNFKANQSRYQSSRPATSLSSRGNTNRARSGFFGSRSDSSSRSNRNFSFGG